MSFPIDIPIEVPAATLKAVPPTVNKRGIIGIPAVALITAALAVPAAAPTPILGITLSNAVLPTLPIFSTLLSTTTLLTLNS